MAGESTREAAHDESRRPRRSIRIRGVGSLGVSLLVMCAALAISRPGVADEMATRFNRNFEPPVVAAGQPVSFNGSSTMPALELTGTRVIPIEARRAMQEPPHGERLWGVRFVVRNLGKTALANPRSISVRVIDDVGHAHMVESRVSAIRRGRLLPVARPIRAGETASGDLVFRLPDDNQITEARITYGSESARWELGAEQDN
jgi:hypothetical protein